MVKDIRALILKIADTLKNNEITTEEAQILLLRLFGTDESICSKCGSNKLYHSTTGKLCCLKCMSEK